MWQTFAGGDVAIRQDAGGEMAVLARIQTRGQLTLPRQVREQAGVKAGDVVMVRVTPAGIVELRPLPSLTVDQLVEMFPIEGPIDEARDRDSWEAEAAADVFGR
jgi:AbrB family looped-hinge helix DNA binding protein